MNDTTYIQYTVSAEAMPVPFDLLDAAMDDHCDQIDAMDRNIDWAFTDGKLALLFTLPMNCSLGTAMSQLRKHLKAEFGELVIRTARSTWTVEAVHLIE